MTPTLLYYLETREPELVHTMTLLFQLAGFKAQPVPTTTRALHFYYGNDDIAAKRAVVSMVRREKDVLWWDLLNGKLSNEPLDNRIPFDLVNAVAFLLGDKGNKGMPPSSYDQHERLLFENSFQARNNIADRPVVNVYLDYLKTILIHHLDIPNLPLWPKGKSGVVILSHDVDRPHRYDFVLNAPLFPKGLKTRSLLKHYYAYGRGWLSYLMDHNRSDHWLFRKVMDEENKLGFRSTFFFASTHRYHANANSDFDVQYDITRKRFVPIFEEMKAEGFEIGLHASYNAHQGFQRLGKEREFLEFISGVQIKGLRRHYWRMKKDYFISLKDHELAGFKYDSSIAFNNDLGFRHSIALPYFPYDLVNEDRINVLEFPVFCMDGALFYDDKMSSGEALQKLDQLIGVIKGHQGLGVLDWHEYTSYPNHHEFHQWGQTYLELLRILAADSEIWVTNFNEVFGWLEERKKTLNQEI